VAVEERPGPVHVELPEDIAAEQADVGLVPPHPIDRPIAPPAALDNAVAMILAAKRPLIMIGAASNRPRLVEPLSDFVRQAGIPFFNTQMGKGAVTGGSNLYLGTAALSERDYVHDAIERADLIIAIGHDTVEKPPFLMGRIAGGPKVIHVGYVAANVEQVFHPDAEVIGDIGATVTALVARLGGRLSPDPRMLELRKEILLHINERADADRFPVIPQRLVHDVRAVMPEDGIVCLDNGMYKIWFARNYRTHVANTLLLDNALATMGAGLPSAISAKLLNPHRRVMVVCGDGGFMMNSQELETAVRLKLDLVVLIIEDSAYGMIRWKQAVDGFADFGMTFGNPDFVTYAESYGGYGHRIAAAAELVPTLEAAFAAGGVHLVAVPIDYSENTRVLVDELGGRVPDVELA
jgi:acetolactate synthase-1/2/3 large subunit